MREIRVLLSIIGLGLFTIGCSKSGPTPNTLKKEYKVKAQQKVEAIEAWRKTIQDFSDSYYEYYKVIDTPIDDHFFDLNDDEFNTVEALVELNELSRDIIYAKSELTFYTLLSFKTLVANIESNNSEGAKEAAQLLEEFSLESGFPDNIEHIVLMAQDRQLEIEKQKTRIINYRSSL